MPVRHLLTDNIHPDLKRRPASILAGANKFARTGAVTNAETTAPTRDGWGGLCLLATYCSQAGRVPSNGPPTTRQRYPPPRQPRPKNSVRVRPSSIVLNLGIFLKLPDEPLEQSHLVERHRWLQTLALNLRQGDVALNPDFLAVHQLIQAV